MIDIFKGQIATSNSDDDHRQLFHWIGNWMSVVATILQDQCDFSDTTRDTLRSLKMIPTTAFTSLYYAFRLVNARSPG